MRSQRLPFDIFDQRHSRSTWRDLAKQKGRKCGREKSQGSTWKWCLHIIDRWTVNSSIGKPLLVVKGKSFITGFAGVIKSGCSHSQACVSYRGRDEGLTSPLPPNRTGGFPASGSPVGGLWIQIDRHAFFGPRLRRSAQGASRRHRPAASLDFSCELSRQAFDSDSCCLTLPCLAMGTRGSLCCSNLCFTPPPSCPPWLHGRYPLPRYYGDSDSCSAPSSTRTGILDS